MGVSIDDMKSCIQEWFAEARTAEDLRETYYNVRQEIDRQFDYMLYIISGGDEE